MATSSAERKSTHFEKYRLITEELERINFNEKSPIFIQQAKLSKALAAFQILRHGNEKDKAVNLARDLCKTAKKYGLLKFCIEPSGFLFRYYSQNEFNRAKALKMQALNTESIDAFSLEVTADRNYSELVLLQRSQHYKKNLLAKSCEFWTSINPFLEKVNSFDFHRIGYIIGLTYYRSKADWKATEELSLRALRFFESYPLRSNPIISVYCRQHINAKLIQGKVNGIPELLNTYKSLIQNNSTNWFLFQYTLCRINLIKNQYTDTHTILKTVIKTRGYNSLPKVNRLAFDIAIAYTQYALNYKNVEFNIPRSLLLAKDEDMFSDQYSLQILIIRLVNYCHHKQWKLVETNSAAISKFLTRKLIRKDQGRSYNFINMLLQLSKRQYHHIAIKRHTNRFYSKLLAQPSSAKGSEQDYEIIPYERLWEMIMENLKR